MSAPIGEDDWRPSPAPERRSPDGPPCRCCGGQRSVVMPSGVAVCRRCDALPMRPS